MNTRAIQINWMMIDRIRRTIFWSGVGLTLLVAQTARGQSAPDPKITAAAATLVPTGDVHHGFRGDVVLVALTTRKCVNCDKVAAWTRDKYDTLGGFGLVTVNVDALPGQEWGNPYLVETLRANGLAWPAETGEQLRAWRASGITDDWPALLVFDRDGELLYAGIGEGALGDAGDAIRTAVSAPNAYVDAPIRSEPSY
jgi:hypothetical protein